MKHKTNDQDIGYLYIPYKPSFRTSETQREFSIQLKIPELSKTRTTGTEEIVEFFSQSKPFHRKFGKITWKGNPGKKFSKFCMVILALFPFS